MYRSTAQLYSDDRVENLDGSLKGSKRPVYDLCVAMAKGFTVCESGAIADHN
jgi:hypothetical protein